MKKPNPKEDSLLQEPGKKKSTLNLRVPEISTPHIELVHSLRSGQSGQTSTTTGDGATSATSQSSHATATSRASDTSTARPTSPASDTGGTGITSETSPTRRTRQIHKKETSPARDFQKVSNSITRGIPEGLFKPGKSKQCYDILYSLTRGAIVPTRTFRMSKPNLMKKTGIGSRITLDAILSDFKTKGLITERQIIGEREGNEYEVFTPDEIKDISEPSPTSRTGQSSGTNATEDLRGLVPLGSTGTSAGDSLMNSVVLDEIKTFLKTFKSDDDKHLIMTGLTRLNEASISATGKGLAKPDWLAFNDIINLIIEETTAAGKRTNGISVYLKFAEANLRRRLYVSKAPRSVKNGNKSSLQQLDGGIESGIDDVSDDEINKWAVEYLDLLAAQEKSDLPPIFLTDEEADIWAMIRTGIEKRLNSDVFTTWFAPVLCEGLDVDAGTLKLRAGQVTADWIGLYYKDLINEVADECGITLTKISWTVAPEHAALENFQRQFTDETWERIRVKAGAGNGR